MKISEETCRIIDEEFDTRVERALETLKELFGDTPPPNALCAWKRRLRADGTL